LYAVAGHLSRPPLRDSVDLHARRRPVERARFDGFAEFGVTVAAVLIDGDG
jgi:hypothetical protein